MKKILANDNNPLSEAEKEEKVQKISKLFGEIIEVLGFDQENDPNLKDTPNRVAKMYVHELLQGNFNEAPKMTVFPNTKEYDEMVLLGPVEVKSLCSHHWQSITGACYISYIPDKKVIGLSKLSRIVQFFSRRPQIQEELTQQIADFVEKLLDPKGVMVVIKAQHHCMTMRGVEEHDSDMSTSAVRGAFANNPETRKEFFDLIALKKDGK